MRAMILAAGFGSRLLPLTDTLPKPMFPVMNRPVMERTIDLLRAHDIRDITVNLHHLPAKVTDYFGDGQRFGVKLNWSPEATILGTAGGIKAAQRYLDGGPFLVINSDIVVDIDLKQVIDFHFSNRSALTLVVKENDAQGVYDPIEIDADNRIVRMVKASSKNAPDIPSRVTFTGIQIMEPDIFERIPAGKFYGTTTEVFPQMVEEKLPVFAFRHEGYWADIGTRASYLRVHKEILDGKIDLDTSQGNSGNAQIVPPVLVGTGCRLSDYARIGPYAVVGDGCEIQDGATIENSVCWAGAVLRSSCTVRDSIIGHHAVVAEGETVSEKIRPA